jgi:hypothetical protein
MDGSMQDLIRSSPAVDPALQEWSIKAKAEGELVSMEASAALLAALLAQEEGSRTWNSGAHVDYFDDDVQAVLKDGASKGKSD